MVDDSSPLAGRVALVTGSSSGIGLAIAQRLAEKGANLILHGRTRSEHLEKAILSMEQRGHEVRSIVQDFSTTEDYKPFVQRAWDLYGAVEILVNNAGADVLTGATAELPFSDKLDLVWKVDVRATLMLSRLFGNRMRELDRPFRCSLLNMGWDQAWQGMAGDSGEMFATSKGAIMCMTKSLAQSLAPRVRVNCLAPGWIKTGWGEEASESWSNRAVAESLMNRWGTPTDIANVAAFVSSDEAGFISGQILPVNGGFQFFQG